MISNNYYSIAMDDYITLQILAREQRYNHVAMFSQQLVEKMLKHIVSLFCVDDPDAEVVLNKHKLKKIYAIIQRNGLHLDLDKKDLTFLEDFYFDTRYPGDNFMSVTKADADECIGITEYIIPKIGQLLTSKGYCAKCGEKLLPSCACPNQGNHPIKRNR